jgi:uncharacterized PurR-regulated membrane protein YhhQ (DUF165 family)
MLKTYAIFLSFLATVPLANYLIQNVGTVCVENGPCLIPVGFGLMAPSGVLLIGVALVLRDLLQEATNWKVSMLAVTLGSVVSFFTSDPFIALASAVAFFSAETLDLLVYTPLRKKGKHIAVLLSGVAGAFVDSILFVYLAFGSLEFSLGNTVGKLYATVIVAAYFAWKVKQNATLPRHSDNT